MLLFKYTQSIVDWSSIMAELPLPQKVGKIVGGGRGCLFTEMYMALKGCLGRKWSASVLVGLHASNCRHLALGQASPRCPHAKWGCKSQAANTWRWATLGARARPTPMAADPGERVWRPSRNALALGPASGPNVVRSDVRTHCSWVLVKTHFAWVLCQDPGLLGPLSRHKVLVSWIY